MVRGSLPSGRMMRLLALRARSTRMCWNAGGLSRRSSIRVSRGSFHSRAVSYTHLDVYKRQVQFTYDLRGTRARLLPRFRKLSSKIVWSNLPPARVEVFERRE